MNMLNNVRIVDEQRGMRNTIRSILLLAFETGLYLEADDDLKTLEVLKREKVNTMQIDIKMLDMYGKFIKKLFVDLRLYCISTFILLIDRSDERMQKNAGAWDASALDQSTSRVLREIRTGL